MQNKTEIQNYIKKFSEYEMIKINGTDKERLVFKNRDEVFNIFGAEEKSVLNPFNDYTYEWLESFLSRVVYHLNNSDAENFEELQEEINDLLHGWVDSEVNIYTSELTAWLAANNSNVEYLNDAIEEYGSSKQNNYLQIAQYKAIEELFFNALPILINDLKEKFEEVQ